MHRRLSAVVMTLSLLTGLHLMSAPSASAHPYCGQVWGSLPKSAEGEMTSGWVRLVRPGRHPCFDRLVVDIAGPLTGWSVRYVDVLRRRDGRLIPLEGGARLEIVARAVQGPVDHWYLPDGILSDRFTSYRTFRDFEVDLLAEGTRMGLGVRGRLPFRAFVLPGPDGWSRLVVDVGHRWCEPGHVMC